MSKNLKVEIWATPNPQATEGYNFEMHFKGKKTDTLTFNKNDDKMKKKENYKISFILMNKGVNKKKDLRFSKWPNTVLWAKTVSDIKEECPKQESHMPDVFYVDPDEVIEDDKLSVINCDQDKQLFKFAFNFLRPGQADGPNTDYACYDPIGSNQNGGDLVGGGFLGDDAIGWTLVGLGIAALASFAFRSWSD